MVQELNITEELKKLLLEGEGGCSVCGKLIYGDGYVVRVFPMELLPSLSGSGMCLKVVHAASAADAIVPPPVTAPAPTPMLPSTVTARCVLACSCALGRPQRARVSMMDR
jgi:hypothetical protein